VAILVVGWLAARGGWRPDISSSPPGPSAGSYRPSLGQVDPVGQRSRLFGHIGRQALIRASTVS
jgi:hypothetical protein